MIAKKAHQFGGGIRPLRIRERTVRSSSRPSVASLMDNPLLNECFAAEVLVDGPGVVVAVCDPPSTGCRAVLAHPCAAGRGGGRQPVVDEAVGVDWVHDGVMVAVEDDQRDARGR